MMGERDEPDPHHRPKGSSCTTRRPHRGLTQLTGHAHVLRALAGEQKGDGRLDSVRVGAQLRDVHGDVSLTTGSGAIVMEDITGSVDVRSAGSGSLQINHVTGTLHVGTIGSGSVTADGIGGDLTVDRKGSGSVNYTNVKGRVDVPSRHRNW